MDPISITDHHHDLDVETALEFLNTRALRGGEFVDALKTPADAASWFVQQGVVHEADAGRWTLADLERVRAVRDAMRDVVDAVVDDRPPAASSVAVVNGALRAAPHPVLEVLPSGLHIGHDHAAAPSDDALARIVEPILGQLAEGGRPDRFRTCANPTCRWSFFDASPTGRRRWCDMKSCGNRAKAARHRAKVRLETPGVVQP